MRSEKSHLILMVLVTLQIIGSFGSIVIWYSQPDMRMSLVVDYTLASNVVGVVAVFNFVALLGIKMKERWGALLVMAFTVLSRVLGFFFFEVNVGQVVFIVWSVVLVVFALFDYKQLSRKERKLTGALSTRYGVIVDLSILENIEKRKDRDNN